jgi:hypothetical protein
MKKLIYIEHTRCGEFDGTTYLWAPSEKTSEEIQLDIDAAQEEYLDKLKKYKETKIPGKALYRIEDCPDNVTVLEAKELIRLSENERKEYQKIENDATQNFGVYLFKKGYQPLYETEDAPVEEFYVNWGHNHGLNIDMSLTGDTDIQIEKKPPPKNVMARIIGRAIK